MLMICVVNTYQMDLQKTGSFISFIFMVSLTSCTEVCIYGQDIGLWYI